MEITHEKERKPEQASGRDWDLSGQPMVMVCGDVEIPLNVPLEINLRTGEIRPLPDPER